MLKTVIKRDGRKVKYDRNKLYNAVYAAMSSHNNVDETLIYIIIDKVESKGLYGELSVEQIQDIVQRTFMEQGEYELAEHYILYRERHQNLRLAEERLAYADYYINSSDNPSTSSETDPNANITLKNVANCEGEMFKNFFRDMQRRRMEKKLSIMYPDFDSKQYSRDLNSHIIYAHDEASTPMVKNYCEAVSLWPMVLPDKVTLDGMKTRPSKHLRKFTNKLVNNTFALSAQCRGAVAYGEIWNFFAWYCVKDFGSNFRNELNELASIRPKWTIKEEIENNFETFVYGINQPQGNRSYQSPFTNVSYYDSNYWHALFDDFKFPDGTKPVWEDVDCIQRLFLNWFNKERTECMLTFPVETMALLSDGTEIIDKEYEKLQAEMYAKGHSFFTYVSDSPDSLSSCCRLRNPLESNEFSFTNGLTGVQTGSANVITLNLNRIVQNFCKEYPYYIKGTQMWYYSFKPYLEEILERVYKYQICFKTLLYEMEDKHQLTASDAGYIKMRSLFLTIGINGFNEAAEFLGMTCDYNQPYAQFAQFITKTISDQNKAHTTAKFKFNTEFVPAEGLSSKNYNWDKEDGYWVPEDRVLYNSYFYLADRSNPLQKLQLHGREFIQYLDGGSGCHINLEEQLSFEQYKALTRYAIKVGCNYFTYNVPNCSCNDCGHIEKRTFHECPVCGSKNIWSWTRVIGFLRPTALFDKYRQAEASTREYSSKDSITF